MARGFHIVDAEDGGDLSDELDELDWEPAVVPAPSSSHAARTLGSTVSAAETAAMHRARTLRTLGTAGNMAGRNNQHCAGCRERPWPDCACCGALAVVALPDPDDSVPHSLSLCARCWATLLAVRAPSVTVRPVALAVAAGAQTQMPGRQGYTRANHNMPFSPAELARIVELRERDRLIWREIAQELDASMEGVRHAYWRHRNRARWSEPVLSPSGSMVSSRPDDHSPRSVPTSAKVVPKTRQRLAQTANLEPPQNLIGARASVKHNKRKASPVVRPPLSDAADLSPTAAAKTASVRKYNTVAPRAVKGAQKRRAVS